MDAPSRESVPRTRRLARRAGIGGAAAIFLVTVAAYVVAFAYDVGYVSYFGVPLEFAQVDLKNLLFCASAFSAIGGLVYGIVELAMWAAPRRLPEIGQTLITVIVLWVGFVLLHVYLAGWGALTIIALACLVPSLLTPKFIRALFSQSKRGELWDSLEPRVDEPGFGRIFMTAAFRIIGLEAFLVVLITLALAITARDLGYFVARTKGTFLMTTAPTDCAVLRQGSDSILCVELDLAKHAIVPRYHLLPRVGETFSLVKTGVLSPPKAQERVGLGDTRNPRG